jgi:hypothetical protein
MNRMGYFKTNGLLRVKTFLLKKYVYMNEVIVFPFPGTQPGTKAGMDLTVEASDLGELQCSDPITCSATCYGAGTESYRW